MNNKLFLLILASMTLNGCFIADELLAPPPEEPKKTLQQKVQESVSDYVENKSGDQEYKIYGYSPVKIVKPLPLIEIEELQKKKESSKDPEHISRKIDSIQTYIDTNNIGRKMKIDHFFTLKDSTTNFSIFETQFTLNEKLEVTDTDPLILLDSVRRFESIIRYYFYEYTIFLADTYEESKNLSRDFYTFFKQELETIQSSKRKSKFLEHVLDLCLAVKETGKFDQQLVLEAIVRKYMLDQRKDIEDYTSLKFSTVYSKGDEFAENESENGYYFFHKFIGSYNQEKDSSVVMVEFTPYYEIDNIYQMEPPFDQYFKN